MKKKGKILLTTAIGLVLLVAVIAAALNAVFTVTDVKVRYSTLSEEGLDDSFALQAELEEKFVGSSTTFLDLEDVREIVEKYPAFRLDGLEKKFPRTLTLSVTERKETYTFEYESGRFAVLDEEGLYLYEKTDNVNRRLGGNVLLEGFTLTKGEAGTAVTGAYFEEALKFCNVFADQLDDIRANLTSIRLVPTGNPIEGDYFFRLLFHEGLYADVYSPSHLTEDKAMAVLLKYRELPDAQRLYGFFDVVDSVNGGFTVSDHRDKLPF